ncbi:MAG: glycerate kinase type-2 family protein [Thermomicrobiales bacterium]
MSSRSPLDPGLEHARMLVGNLFDAALAAVEPTQAVRAAISLRDGSVVVGDDVLDVPHGVHIVAIGKAAVTMTQGALDVLGNTPVSGDVITKDGHVGRELPASIRVHEAGHPIPDERGVRATEELLGRLENLGGDVPVIALISGGGSALLEAPRDGLSLLDLATTTGLLLRAGAPIEVLNAVRAPLSRVKSGGLLSAAPQATWVTLILSDVLGNDPRIIASGPTVPGQRDSGKALALIERFGLSEDVPPAVVGVLERADGEQDPAQFERDVLLVIGDNAAAVEAAADAARARGLHSQIIWNAKQGEAADLGRAFVDEIANASRTADVVLGGGEMTVTVRGDGRGGRNTEFALAAARELERRGLHDWVVASLATDGQDALTGLAGAIADSGTSQRARDGGIDPDAALARNDSATVFDIAGGAVMTGPTGTNVNDLYIAVRMTNEPMPGVNEGGR